MRRSVKGRKMGHKRKKHQKHKGLLVFFVVIAVVLVGLATWMIVGLSNQEIYLDTVEKINLPEFASLDKQFKANGDFAVVLDGEVTVKNGDDDSKVRPTASTAKMILGLAVMQEKPFSKGESGETITITPEYYNRFLWYLVNNGSNTKVAIGEEISEYDALVSIFLASSNNMADTLAMWAFGSLDNYREYANKMLNEWGLDDTTVGVDASGFDASTTSTAADLAQIGKKVLDSPVLAEIVGAKSYEVPVAGLLDNTNKLLGTSGIIGVKTGYIGDESGYCLVAGYRTGEHVITTALLDAPSREISFSDSLGLVNKAQELLKEQTVVKAGDEVGYYDSWWTGRVSIKSNQELKVIGWKEADISSELIMDGTSGILKVTIGEQDYKVPVTADEYNSKPDFWQRIKHLFGWNLE